MKSKSLSSSIVLRSSACFSNASARRSDMAVCARVSAWFFSATSSCNRAMVDCATAVTCATADSSPAAATPPPRSFVAACASNRRLYASRSSSAFFADSLACATSRSICADFASASAARSLSARIASICCSTMRCVSADAPPGETPTAAAAPTAANASALARRRGCGTGVTAAMRPSSSPFSPPTGAAEARASSASRFATRNSRWSLSIFASDACFSRITVSSILPRCVSRSAAMDSRYAE